MPTGYSFKIAKYFERFHLDTQIRSVVYDASNR